MVQKVQSEFLHGQKQPKFRLTGSIARPGVGNVSSFLCMAILGGWGGADSFPSWRFLNIQGADDKLGQFLGQVIK
jgi:hypothetical protein